MIALYQIQLAAAVADISNKTYTQTIFHPLFHTNMFLYSLADQRGPGFDICLCDRLSSHLYIFTRNKVLPLSVTLHVWPASCGWTTAH